MRKTKFFVFMAVLLTAALIISFSISRRPRAESAPTGTSDVGASSRIEEATAVTTNGPSNPVRSFPNPVDPEAIEIEHGLKPLPFGKMRPEYIQYAENKGARGKLTILVVDVDGKPVDGAGVYANFFTYGKDEQERTVTTSSDGRAEVEGISCSDMWFSVNKPGYYETRVKYWFFKAGFDCVADGRWIPWNPVLEVVLKDERTPVEMIRHSAQVYLPKSDEPIGYDCIENDLVQPFGKGKVSDLLFTFSSVGGFQGRINRHYTNELVIATGGNSSVLIAPHDNWSQLKSSHEAPQAGYLVCVKMSTKVSTPYLKDDIVDDLFQIGQHIVFRSRVVTNEFGKVMSANYGKIYPPFVYGDAPPDKGVAGVAFTYYFNPNPNDPNLERKPESPHDGVF